MKIIYCCVLYQLLIYKSINQQIIIFSFHKYIIQLLIILYNTSMNQSSNSRNLSPKYKLPQTTQYKQQNYLKSSNQIDYNLSQSRNQNTTNNPKYEAFLEAKYPNLSTNNMIQKKLISSPRSTNVIQNIKDNQVSQKIKVEKLSTPASPKKESENFNNTNKIITPNSRKELKIENPEIKSRGNLKSPKLQDNLIYKQLIKFQQNINKRLPRLSQSVYENQFETSNNFNKDNGSSIVVTQNLLPKRQNKIKKTVSMNLTQNIKMPQKQLSYVNEKKQTEIDFDSNVNLEAFKKQKELKQTISTNSTSKSKQDNFCNFTKNIKMQKNKVQINDFFKGKILGSGKFGNVYIVKHKLTGFICAMKCIPKTIIRQQNIVNQLIRQLKIQSCVDHPNIIKMYGFFDDPQFFYLLLELASVGQLYTVLKQKKRFSQNKTSYIIKQVCQSIRYLQSMKIIHRDIKPQNIVIQYGMVKLCDFGWAVCRGTELRSTFCGTPLYVSPQILKGEQYDQRIDLWAIGILTYELLIGQIPFDINCQEELVKIVNQQIVFPVDIKISNCAKDFILKVLKKNPQERIKISQLIQHPFINLSKQISIEFQI